MKIYLSYFNRNRKNNKKNKKKKKKDKPISIVSRFMYNIIIEKSILI